MGKLTLPKDLLVKTCTDQASLPKTQECSRVGKKIAKILRVVRNFEGNFCCRHRQRRRFGIPLRGTVDNFFFSSTSSSRTSFSTDCVVVSEAGRTPGMPQSRAHFSPRSVPKPAVQQSDRRVRCNPTCPEPILRDSATTLQRAPETTSRKFTDGLSL